jgi:hypothetical protein
MELSFSSWNDVKINTSRNAPKKSIFGFNLKIKNVDFVGIASFLNLEAEKNWKEIHKPGCLKFFTGLTSKV